MQVFIVKLKGKEYNLFDYENTPMEIYQCFYDASYALYLESNKNKNDKYLLSRFITYGDSIGFLAWKKKYDKEKLEIKQYLTEFEEELESKEYTNNINIDNFNVDN